MKILLCDDDPIFGDSMERMLETYEMNHREEFVITKVHSGKEVLERLAEDEYSILFLDIEMPQMNGVEVGTFIRNIQKNYKLKIIYVSFNSSYALSLFQCNPFDFLIKPVKYEQIEQLMDKLLECMGMVNDIFVYQKKGQVCRKRVDEILYFESNLKKTILVTEDDTDEFYASLKDVYEELKEKKFFYCHKSILVNYQKVKEVHTDYLVLVNGESLDISQAKRKEVKKILMDWA